MIYHVYNADTPVADVYTDNGNEVTKIDKLVPDGIMQPFSGDDASTLRFYNFLKSRCYEDGRADLPEILEVMGLSWNSPYDFCRKTHGVTWEDFFWIRYDGEDITWEDVRVR